MASGARWGLIRLFLVFSIPGIHGKMASGARWGLIHTKHPYSSRKRFPGKMASGARWGLIGSSGSMSNAADSGKMASGARWGLIAEVA